MDTVVRKEFIGSWLWVTILFFTGIGIPLGIIYLIDNTIELHTEVSDSEELMRLLRTGKYKK